MSREKIIFLSATEPFTTRGWSGIPYFMYRSLQDHYDVVFVKSPDLKVIKRAGYYINRFLAALGLGKIFFDGGFIVGIVSGLLNTRSIKKHRNIKFIFSPAGSTDICFVRTDVPIVNCGDCSLLQLIGYYPALQKVMPFSVNIVRSVEARAFRKAKANIFSSSWAGDFVKREYSLATVGVVPFGANLSKDHPGNITRVKSSDRCTLIFVGVDWYRKGGDITLAVREELEELGIDCTLIIVGPAPRSVSGPKIEVVRDLVKHQQEDAYADLFRRSDFMILPTLADCTPIVIAESFAFGVPVLATSTGGIGDMIRDDIDGFTIKGNSPSAFTKTIAQLLPDAKKREKMSAACRESYLNIFNWDKWSAGVVHLIK